MPPQQIQTPCQSKAELNEFNNQTRRDQASRHTLAINRCFFFLQGHTQLSRYRSQGSRGFGLLLDVLFIMPLTPIVWRNRRQGSAAGTSECSRDQRLLMRRSSGNNNNNSHGSNDSAASGKIVVRLKPMTQEESDQGETLCLSAAPRG